MRDVSQRFLNEVGRPSGTYLTTAQVWNLGKPVLGADGKVITLQVTGGGIAVDESANVRRTLTLNSADIDLDPNDITDLLAPYGAELAIWTGFIYSDSTSELVPVGVFPITTTTRSSYFATLDITAEDRMGTVTKARFIKPRTIAAGTLYTAAIKALVLEVLPYVSVFDLTGSKVKLAKALVTERERMDAVTALADAIGAEVFFDGTGRCVIRTVPVITSKTVPAWTTASGDDDAELAAALTATPIGSPPPRLDVTAVGPPVKFATLHLGTFTVLQCAVRQAETGEFYTTQNYAGTTGSYQTTVISRCRADGSLVDAMTCTNGGHGTSFVAEYVGPGETWIWLTWQAPAVVGQPGDNLVRFRYRGATTLARSAIPASQVLPTFLDAGVYANVSADWRSGWITQRIPTSTVERYVRRTPEQWLAGLDVTYGEVDVPVAGQTMQGYATIGDDFYYYEGTGDVAVSNRKITRYSWTTGAVTAIVDTNDIGKNADGTTTGNYREPEGVSGFANVDGSATLLAGVTTGSAGSRIWTLFAWAAPPAATPATMSAATLVDYSDSVSDDQVYNAVAVTSVVDDKHTVFAVAYLNTGPGRYRPGYERPRFYSTTLIKTAAAAQKTAATLLARSVLFYRTVDPTSAPNPALESGDPIRITLPSGETYLRTLASFTIPFAPSSMQLMMRIPADIAIASDVGTFDAL